MATRRTGPRTCGSPTRTAAVRSTTRGCCRSNRRSCRSWSARSRFQTIASTSASSRRTPSRTAQPRRAVAQQNHNPTVFKNLVFNGWYGHGIRVIDISNPHTPREVGYAMPVPHGIARTYPVFRDGLIYWVDNRTGLHVATIHGSSSRRVARIRHGYLRGQRDEPASVSEDRLRTSNATAASRVDRLRAFLVARDDCCRRALQQGSGRCRHAQLAPRTIDETAWVCPMHSDYTADNQGKCPRCGMALVHAAPFDVRDYELDFRTVPAAVKAGQKATLRFRIFIPARGESIRKFETVHETAVPPVRHQPGHGALRAHPPARSWPTARGRST